MPGVRTILRLGLLLPLLTTSYTMRLQLGAFEAWTSSTSTSSGIALRYAALTTASWIASLGVTRALGSIFEEQDTDGRILVLPGSR
jgi:hypothetical protein